MIACGRSQFSHFDPVSVGQMTTAVRITAYTYLMPSGFARRIQFDPVGLPETRGSIVEWS